MPRQQNQEAINEAAELLPAILLTVLWIAASTATSVDLKHSLFQTVAVSGFVIVGAGIPTRFPGLLDHLSRNEPVSYEIQVVGSEKGEVTSTHLDPREYVPDAEPLARPRFLSIISSNVLAVTMMKRSTAANAGRPACGTAHT